MSTWTHERKETHRTTVTHIGLNMFTYSESFKRIRYKDTACKFCHRKFIDDQFVHIAFTDKGNKLLCTDCTDKAIANGVSFIDKKGQV
jgi:superfamily II helicase